MKLFGVTFTYNESIMIPYVMKYLEHMGFNKLIVYDNQSTDNTVKLLKQYKFVEVRTLDTGGKKSNSEIVNVKNKVWKEFRHEKDAWMFVSDFDEVLYYPGSLKEYLEQKSKEGYNCLNQEMMETVCEHFPDKSKFVHEVCDGGTFWDHGCKMTLFKVGEFDTIKYAPGAHSVEVTLNNGKKLKSLNDKEIKSFHLKWIDYKFCLSKKNLAQSRRGKDDIKHGYGTHYIISDDEFKKKWDIRKSKLVSVNNYTTGKVRGCNAIGKIVEIIRTKPTIGESEYPNIVMKINNRKIVKKK